MSGRDLFTSQLRSKFKVPWFLCLQPTVKLTRRRYAFSKEMTGSIGIAQANRDMALTSLSYLCSETLYPELSDAELEKYLLSGRYRLLGYVTFHWTGLSSRYLRNSSKIDSRFAEMLDKVAQHSMNDQFEAGMDSQDTIGNNRNLQKLSSIARFVLGSACRFHDQGEFANWQWSTSG
jgi:hypothetical protein